MSNVINISYCNKASNRIVFKQKGISVFFWIILSHKVSRLSPYTHTHQHMRASRIFCIFTVPRGGYTPSLVENLMSHGRRKNKFNSGSSVADCVHTAIFQNIRENHVPCNANQIQGEVPTHGSQICIYNKKK